MLASADMAASAQTPNGGPFVEDPPLRTSRLLVGRPISRTLSHTTKRDRGCVAHELVGIVLGGRQRVLGCRIADQTERMSRFGPGLSVALLGRCKRDEGHDRILGSHRPEGRSRVAAHE